MIFTFPLGTLSTVPTFIIRTKPFGICFGVDAETHEVACVIYNGFTILKVLHAPKDDDSSDAQDGESLSTHFKDLKAYHIICCVGCSLIFFCVVGDEACHFVALRVVVFSCDGF